MVQENLYLKYVRDVDSHLVEEIIGFVNADGGRILVGVDSICGVVGVENIEKNISQIKRMLKREVLPDIMPFVQIQSIEIDGLDGIDIQIVSGLYKPYFLKKEGMNEKGAFIHCGVSYRSLYRKEMLAMLESDFYEDQRSFEQDLTFTTFEKKAFYKEIQLCGEDGLYTNLAYILSDQFEISTKITFDERETIEFKGSVCKQIRDVLDYLDLSSYPLKALQEVIVNSFKHRDYSLSSSNLIHVGANCMDVISCGDLVSNIEEKSIYLGICQSRNPKLSHIFHLMGLCKNCGMGIRQVQFAYKDCMTKPQFDVAKGVFHVCLPNIKKQPVISNRVCESVDLYGDHYMSVIQYAKEHGYIGRKDVEDILDVGTTKAYHVIQSMVNQGVLDPVGNGRMKKYVLNTKDPV